MLRRTICSALAAAISIPLYEVFCVIAIRDEHENRSILIVPPKKPVPQRNDWRGRRHIPRMRGKGYAPRNGGRIRTHKNPHKFK